MLGSYSVYMSSADPVSLFRLEQQKSESPAFLTFPLALSTCKSDFFASIDVCVPAVTVWVGNDWCLVFHGEDEENFLGN